MSNIIPRSIYKTIEYRLHTYELMKTRISEWEASIYSHNKTIAETSSKAEGFYSDPTALTVIKMLNPPNDIKTDMCWVNTIDRAREHFIDCNKSKECLFEFYYGKDKRSVTAILNDLYCEKQTFYNWRDDLVNWIAMRATQHNLIKFD